MSSLVQRIDPRVNPRAKLALEVGTVLLLVFMLFCVWSSMAFADPIGDVTSGGTAPDAVKNPMKNFVAVVVIVVAGLLVACALAGVFILAGSGGSSKFGKGMFMWGLIGLGIVSALAGFAQWTTGLFNGIMGIDGTSTAP